MRQKVSLPYDLRHSSIRQHVNAWGEAKRAFATRVEAEAAADALQRQPNASRRRPYRAYRCESCGKFHVGRKPVRASGTSTPLASPEMPVGSAATHQKQRQMLRKKLRGQGVSENEIEARVAELRERQTKRREGYT